MLSLQFSHRKLFEAPMDHIRRLAWISVARGCGFGALAVFCFMFGFITTPPLALDAGGFGFLLMAAILMVKAGRAHILSHKRTELWLMLDPERRPPPEVASGVITRMRRETMLRFAYLSALVACGCLALAAMLKVAGFQ
jgi:hypothetical protein